MHENFSETLNLISISRLEDEQACVAKLMEAMQGTNYNHAKAAAIAKSYIENFRADAGGIGLEEFFRQYGLETNEGLAVMSLSEALLRIPDSHTANLFIHDKLKSASWSKNGKSGSSIVKASNLGLKVASKLMELGSTVSTLADPIIRESLKQSMKLIGDHFVLGETTKEALKKARQFEAEGYTLSYDMLGEGARNEDQAQKYLENYLNGVEEVAKTADKSKGLYERPGISVKLSALYPKYQLTNKEMVFKHLIPRLKQIILKAKSEGISVTIDAEESSRLDISLEIFTKLVSDSELGNFDGIGLAVQAYNKSAVHVIDYICNLAKETSRQIPVRLVKGAYWDSEIKSAQISGLSAFPVFSKKEYSDISYLACANKMLENADIIYPQFATHNALTIASIEVMAAGKNNYEFQRLYGMGTGIYNHIAGRIPCRIYAPVGAHQDLLPYLIRRILENGASASFLKKIIDSEITVEELVADPLSLPLGESDLSNYKVIGKKSDVELQVSQGTLTTSLSKRERVLRLPPDLYGTARKNSTGFDLGNSSHLEKLKKDLARFYDKSGKCSPIINGKERSSISSLLEDNIAIILAPYNINISVGSVHESLEEDTLAALDTASLGFKSWSTTSVQKRAEIIEKFADLLEENSCEIMALCTMEAGKTISDSIAELREAVDFCRYYAVRAKELFATPKKMQGPTGELNELSLHGRGVFVCISPWNFPLAIFTGQIVAALASGNAVIAKPAEQTPLIASFAVKLLLKAGLPKNAISLLPGDGASIGKILLNDKRIAGVAFTGSCDTANIISQTLTARSGAIVPFIAETGGLNAMIVDSSAHLEQAVDDIILSAFGSAGQRCSALRVLYVQEDIAGKLIETLKGAMEILKVGSPADFSTDIGPVIDGDAHKNLSDYIYSARRKFKVLAEAIPNHFVSLPDVNAEKDPEIYQYNNQTQIPQDEGSSYFIYPIAFEIDSIKDLPGEVFGPVLHIIRFKANEFETIIDSINDVGYGLTIGLQTRITSRINYLREHAHTGNMYVNRSMIGATVGVQPFGGEGLSGTGFKAGGPNYLLRFAVERCFTENTAAIGGNRELLA